MSDYTPPTAAIRGRIIQRGGGWGFYGLSEFDAWLAAHDAEKRAEWEAEQGETEWEYGVESRFEMGGAVFDAVEWGSAEQAEAVARDRNDDEAEQDEDLRLIHRVVKRVASTPAGPWVSVDQENE